MNDALAAVSDAGIRPLRAAPVGTRAHVFPLSLSPCFSLSYTQTTHTLSLPYSPLLFVCVSACLRFQERLPENELTGTIFMVNAGGSLIISLLSQNSSFCSPWSFCPSPVSAFRFGFYLALGVFPVCFTYLPGPYTYADNRRAERRERVCVCVRERETHAKRHRPFSSLPYVRRLCEHACNTYTRIERSVSRESKPNGLCECFYDGKITLIADNPNNLTTAHINRVCTVGVGGDFELEIQPLQAKQR